MYLLQNIKKICYIQCVYAYVGFLYIYIYIYYANDDSFYLRSCVCFLDVMNIFFCYLFIIFYSLRSFNGFIV